MRISGASGLASMRGAVDRIAAGRVAAIRPVEHAIFQIEFEIDRLRQMVEEDLDVRAVGGGLAFGDVEPGAQEEALLSIVGPLLRPVDLLAHGIDGDPYAPPRLVASIGVAAARLDQRFDERAVEVGAHDAHPLAIAPVELAVLLIELELLWRMRGAGRNEDPAIASIEIGALDRAVVGRDAEAHVRPVDMAGLEVDRDAVREMTVGDDDLSVGTVGPHRVDAVAAQLEDEQTADCGLAVGGGFRFGHETLIHVVLLCERALTRRAQAGRFYAAGVDFVVAVEVGRAFLQKRRKRLLCILGPDLDAELLVLELHRSLDLIDERRLHESLAGPQRAGRLRRQFPRRFGRRGQKVLDRARPVSPSPVPPRAWRRRAVPTGSALRPGCARSSPEASNSIQIPAPGRDR